MEPKFSCLHKTEAANNHIEHYDSFVFARNPVGLTYNEPVAMPTNGIHTFPKGQQKCHVRVIVNWQ
jgi:hypothetical protein